MHKLFLAWVVAAAAIFSIAGFELKKASAATTSSWISTSPSILKQADTNSVPTTFSDRGNIDCTQEDSANCLISTPYGAVTGNSTVRLNNEEFSLTNKNAFVPVYTYIENRERFLPIPNSGTAISYTTGPVYGFYFYFNYNFSSSLSRTGGLGSLLPAEYHINRPPDGKLADKSNHLLAADTASMTFSENGKWMVISDPNVAMLRVNLQTFEVLPFAPGLNYTIGLDPSIKTAITNDGRYSVIASKNFSVFKIYDLSTCAAVPNTINASVNCQSRDLNSIMQQTVPGYSFIASARFNDDSSLAVYVVYKSGTANKTARFIISTNGFVNQVDYLALGDSYISGEGAFDYAGGTDSKNNQCHLSFLSYSFLIGRDIDYNSYNSVACSGATSDDIINASDSYAGQADDRKIERKDRSATEIDSILASFKPGYIDQIDFVKTYQPKVITLSIGGNDMGFANIVQSCAQGTGTCYSTYEERLELVRLINSTVFNNLVKTYTGVKAVSAPNTRIYVVGYPQIAKPGGDCALNVHLNNDEVLFAKQLIDYLDSIIQKASAKAGVYYVDTQEALLGHRLCEAGPGSVAVNGLTAGNDFPDKSVGPVGRESYHPNSFGYQLLENRILSATHNLTEMMPIPDLMASPPSETGIEFLNVPHSGRSIKTAEYDPSLSADLVYKNTPTDISISGATHSLLPGSILQAELHSNPYYLGNFRTGANGDLLGSITVPSVILPGYHSLHFYGTDLSGQSIDIYKTVYIAATTTDFDGGGINDSAEACGGVPISGTDYDKDGIDDACDGYIAEPPYMPDSINGISLESITNNSPINSLEGVQTNNQSQQQLTSPTYDVSLSSLPPAFASEFETTNKGLVLAANKHSTPSKKSFRRSDYSDVTQISVLVAGFSGLAGLMYLKLWGRRG